VTAVVADASILVVSLTQLDTEGAECRDWLTHILNGDDLYILANQTLLEVSAALRRLALEEKIKPEWAENFHRRSSDPLFIRQQLTNAQMGRIWELRKNVKTYDAAYVAIAESLSSELMADVRIATTDGRLTRASGPTCGFHLWPPPHGVL